ncbi:MAG: protein kinase [Anaerolineales bacterium]|nr:protein kinase [Anaerolineales bacterium]
MLPETIGRYQIREELGRGPSTIVYRAFDMEANREVAVKVLAVEQAPDISQRAHFKRELKMIASLEHPAIVPVYDVGEHNGQPYFVMRYMAGGSLTQLIAAKGKLSLEETARIIDRIASALDHAHKQHIIHRDIKPDNILFDLDGNPYISDFGVAKPAATSDASPSEGQVGTPGYMSPEQMHQEMVDERSDVYSLGVVVYQMLTGRKKSRLESKTSPLRSRPFTQPSPDILSEVPELPPEVGEILNICLAENKRDRYVSTLHLARALNKAAFGEEQVSRFLDRYGNWAAIRTSLFWIAGSVVLLLGFFWMFAGGGNLPFLSPAPTPTASLFPSPTAVPPTETFTATVPTATPQPASTPIPTPTVPGGADMIALVSGNDIYLMNTDGSNLVQVRSENSPKSNLQWIPGNRLVYISRNCAYLLDAETKETEQLSCFNANELLEGYSVSPDGKLVAISIQRTLNIFPFDVEMLQTVTTRFNLLDKKENCYYNQFPFREVLWSKDGRRLAAHVIDTRFVNSDQVFLLSVDIENCANVALSRLDTIPGGRIAFDSESSKRLGSFDWNGKNLFLLNDLVRNDGFGNLYLYNSETREAVKLNPINGECCYRDPHWSPDGKYIVFAFQRFDLSDISLYYIPFDDLQDGGPFTPINLPSRFFSTPREKPQPVLRPAP